MKYIEGEAVTHGVEMHRYAILSPMCEDLERSVVGVSGVEPLELSAACSLLVNHIVSELSLVPRLCDASVQREAVRQVKYFIEYVAVVRGCTYEDVAGYFDVLTGVPDYDMVFSLAVAKPVRMAWHIPEGEVYGDGYCYLAVIDGEIEDEAKERLGRYPSLLQLAQVPREWFNDSLYTAHMVTDDFDKPVPMLKAESFFQVMRGVTHNFYEYEAGSLAESLEDVGPADYVPVVVPLLDVLGGCKVWHVTTDNVSFNSTFPEGLCYQHMFKYKLRYDMVRKLGKYPTMDRLLRLPKTVFRPKSYLSRVLIVRHEGDRLRAYSAHDVFTILAARASQLPSDSLGVFLIERFPPQDFSMFDFPQECDKVGSFTEFSAVMFDIVEAKRSVYVPPISVESAERAFDDTVKSWGVTSGEDKEDVLDQMAAVLTVGSRDDVFANASLEVQGRDVPLADMLNSIARVCTADNKLRLWVRSFRGGEMCTRISKVLADEKNVQLRQVAASKYFAPLELAHLCFDTVRTYARISKLRYVERVFVRVARAIRFSGKPMDPELNRWLTTP